MINLLVVGITIFMSYYSNTGAMNGNTMGSLSNRYDTLFTPAGYAFSIWGLIYLGLIGHALSLFKLRNARTVKSQAQWMALANLGNCAWVFLWLYEYTGLSTIAMAFILLALVILGLKTNTDQTLTKWIVWPVSIYLGWITVALAANVSAYLAKINFEFLLSDAQWATVLIFVATGIYVLIVRRVKLKLAALVGTWAFVAIASKQWDVEVMVQLSALLCAACLLLLGTLSKPQSQKT